MTTVIRQSQEKQLHQAIVDFMNWVVDKVGERDMTLSENDRVQFSAASPKDWIMRVVHRDGKRIVQFNPYLLSHNKCSFEYFRTVVLHECFHLFVQHMPNKVDAQRLRDDFGDILMKLMDIEADYFTALYLKERKGYSLIDQLKLFYEGSQVFGDPSIRRIKVERFIGTILSITKAYFDHPGPRSVCMHADLYLPCIDSLTTEESLHVVVAKKEHFYLTEIAANHSDFIELKLCYTNKSGYTVEGYVERILRFATKAHKCDKLPAPILKQLQALKREMVVKKAELKRARADMRVEKRARA